MDETDEEYLKHMVKFVKSDLKYLANKLNMYAMATFLAKTEVMKVLDDRFEKWATFEYSSKTNEHSTLI
jgi:hypothetical protein